MTDAELIDLVARVWFENGGDAEGIVYCWEKIWGAVKELEETEGDAQS